MALISLEDLEGLDEEELDDDISDNPEPMDEQDRDRLLTHWRAVASTHQVSVPTEDLEGLDEEELDDDISDNPEPMDEQDRDRLLTHWRAVASTHQDLEGLDEEELDDDISDNPEPMDEQDRDRLLTHWRAVASTHQVSVPTEMSGPIQEMTRNRQQREPIPFAAVSRHEKMGEVLFEERVYPAGKWACVTHREHLYEQSISMSFMKLMRFICKENSAGRYLGMTVPVVSSIQVLEDGAMFDKDVETAFFLPAEFQSGPPLPTDPDIIIVHREPIRVLARVFFGTTTEETVGHQIQLLWELLGPSDHLQRTHYMVAVYDNPGSPQRRNEIWFLLRDQ